MNAPIPDELTRSQRRVLEAVSELRVTADDVALYLAPHDAQTTHHRLAVTRILLRLWKRGLIRHEGQHFWRDAS